VDCRCLDQVVVVQHQHDLVGQGGQLVDQGGHHRIEGGGPQATPQQRGDLLGDARADPVERGGGVPPEPRWVVVAGVQRQPGDRPSAAPGPVRQQDGLAEAGRRAHQDQLAAVRLGKPVGQPGAGHKAGTGARDVQLGGQQHIPLGGGGRSWGRGGRLSHRCPQPLCLLGHDGFPDDAL
jgi:hypothetical protein